MNAAIRFGVVSAVRSAAHQLADFWIQRPRHAVDKGRPGPAGAVPCAWHVLSYTLTSAAAVAAANKLFDLGLTGRGQLLGELISAVTHYVADRREHGALYPLADVLGKGDYLRHGGGSMHLDQAWHETFNAIASCVTALDAR
ncbi:MAG TPA: transcriptional regulator [Pseudonocardia sp.]